MDHGRVQAKPTGQFADRFRASDATLALNSGWCCFRFDIVDLLGVEDQQATNRSLP
jgi:hypothetical protein